MPKFLSIRRFIFKLTWGISTWQIWLCVVYLPSHDAYTFSIAGTFTW